MIRSNGFFFQRLTQKEQRKSTKKCSRGSGRSWRKLSKLKLKPINWSWTTSSNTRWNANPKRSSILSSMCLNRSRWLRHLFSWTVLTSPKKCTCGWERRGWAHTSCSLKWPRRKEMPQLKSLENKRLMCSLPPILLQEELTCPKSNLWSIMTFPRRKKEAEFKVTQRLTFTESEEQADSAGTELHSPSTTETRTKNTSTKLSSTMAWKPWWTSSKAQTTWRNYSTKLKTCERIIL